MKRIVQMPPSGSLLAALGDPSKGISIEIAVDDEKKYPAGRLAEIIVDFAKRSKFIYAPKGNEISQYKYVVTVQKSTLKRAGLSGKKRKQLANFQALTPEQRENLGIGDVIAGKGKDGINGLEGVLYYPIFLGGKHMGGSAMNLVKQKS
jgi:hypothetical protein